MMKAYYIFIYLLVSQFLCAQVGTNGEGRTTQDRPIKEYNLIIKKEKISLGGIQSDAMTINGSVPGPNLEFTEGDLAIIHVTNEMSVETSVHWHGLILPNYQDGVPYLTTPPIKPGTTFTYEIPINQAGTYWYHSHTMLQEQKGVYGSISIQPKVKEYDYDKELVVVLSDWTNEDPMIILKNLKRGNEWYQVKKNTAVPLSEVIERGALGAQLKMWRDRMEGADIADIYYPAFLTNGKTEANYKSFKPGEKVRLRFINASASTYFWLDFGGGEPLLIAADGINVKPVKKDRLLFAIAETYDFIVTIPDGQLEIIATAQDGSGHTKLHLGDGTLVPAAVISQPDKIAIMQDMAKMDMEMGAPALKFNPSKKNPKALMDKYGMKMDHSAMDHSTMDHSAMNHPMDHSMHQDRDAMHAKKDSTHMNMTHEEHLNHEAMDHNEMNHAMDHSMHQDIDTMHAKKDSTHMNMAHEEHMGHNMENMDMEMPMNTKSMEFNHIERAKHYNYNFLEATDKTSFNENIEVVEYLFNLTGNMNRYIWSINGVPVTESDKIKIEKGKVTQITLNNLTMMHHPMHLHGHYFRVINENGERSPLKHTVNVAPMQKLTIEFLGEETGDWLFHCHVLYHMMGGMTRIMSYDTPQDDRMLAYPVENLLEEMDEYFFWGTADVSSSFTEASLVVSNIRNEWNLDAEYGYNEDLEAELSYNRYLNDWVRVYIGVNTESEGSDSFNEFNTVGKAGIKYFTPYMFNLDVGLDHQLRPSLAISRELLLLPRFFIEGEYEFMADFGVVNDLEDNDDIFTESEWSIIGEYMISRNFSAIANYHSDYMWGGGLKIRF